MFHGLAKNDGGLADGRKDRLPDVSEADDVNYDSTGFHNVAVLVENT